MHPVDLRFQRLQFLLRDGQRINFKWRLFPHHKQDNVRMSQFAHQRHFLSIECIVKLQKSPLPNQARKADLGELFIQIGFEQLK
jgi:hypothetical protein